MIDNREDGPVIETVISSPSEVNEKKINDQINSEPTVEFSSEAKKFVDKIKDKIINKSESSFEPPPIDYNKEYTNLIKCKDIANQYFQNKNIDISLDSYLKIDNDIDYYLKNLDAEPNREMFKEILFKFIELRKFIFSNISRAYVEKKYYREAIKHDEFIIYYIDGKFDKSYGRLIQCYMLLGELDRASTIREIMKKYFDFKVINNYKDLFNNLDEKLQLEKKDSSKLNKKFIKNLKHMNQEDHLIKETETETKTNSDKQVVKKNKNSNQIKKPNNFYKWLFGGFILTFSSTALFYIFKIKEKFRVQKK